MDYLPSKKFIKTVTTTLLVMVGAWFVFYGANRFIVSNKKISETQNSVSARAFERMALDSDNDGLKDWEEVIWGTDPHNPDTDGDGAPDGEEVKLHRDPTKLGPNDALPDVKELAQSHASSTLPVTDQLNFDLATRYLITKGLNQGAPLNTQQKSNLSDIFTRNIQKRATDHQDEYSEKDIVVSVRKNPRNYINDIAEAIQKYFNGISGSELDIVHDAAATKDPSRLVALDPYIAAYEKTIVFLKREEVPPTYIDVHLELLNSVNNLRYGDTEMKYLSTDPARVIVGAQIFGAQVSRLFNLFKNLKAHMDRDSILFQTNEPAYFFYKFFNQK